MSDIDCTSQLSRTMAVPDIFGILHVPLGILRDHRWKHKLRQWSGMYHLVELQFVPQRNLRRRTAAADIPGICELSCGQLSDVAWIAELSGRLQLSAASTDHPRSKLRDSLCSGDHARESDVSGRRFMRAQSDLSEIRHLCWRADLCACGNLRR